MTIETRYVIRNTFTGAYIHKSLFKIRAFYTRYEAVKYMRRRGISERCYELEEIGIARLSAKEK